MYIYKYFHILASRYINVQGIAPQYIFIPSESHPFFAVNEYSCWHISQMTPHWNTNLGFEAACLKPPPSVLSASTLKQRKPLFVEHLVLYRVTLHLECPHTITHTVSPVSYIVGASVLTGSPPNIMGSSGGVQIPFTTYTHIVWCSIQLKGH